ncbi:MAG: FAD-binding protein, partial [Pseudomonadota bacterium]
MLSSVSDAFLDNLRNRLPDGVLRPVGASDLEEPRGAYHGRAGIVACPDTPGVVSTLIKAASEARVPIVPIAGGTGLVGGQVMPEGPVPLLLSMERMTAIRAVYPRENVLVAEAGAILAQVQDAAREADRLSPPESASLGRISAQTRKSRRRSRL